MALRCADCRLTRKVVGPDGLPSYIADVDESGRQKFGPVTHSYSIASAPFETAREGYLEFHVVLERDENDTPGRLTEFLFSRGNPEDRLTYVDRIVGNFTLAKRAHGFNNVLLVATGTGIAPFVSMLKQLDREAAPGQKADVRYTLIFANRTKAELGYHEELLRVQERGAIDFIYLPSVSRPRPEDFDDPILATGRANNVLRTILGLPTMEQEALESAQTSGVAAARLPMRYSQDAILSRIPAGKTVVLTCGNAALMEDVRKIAARGGFRFEKEDW